MGGHGRGIAPSIHGDKASRTRTTAAPYHRRPLLNRELHSSSSTSTTAAPPTSGDKDKIIEELRLRLRYARASAGVGGFMLTGILGLV